MTTRVRPRGFMVISDLETLGSARRIGVPVEYSRSGLGTTIKPVRQPNVLSEVARERTGVASPHTHKAGGLR